MRQTNLFKDISSTQLYEKAIFQYSEYEAWRDYAKQFDTKRAFSRPDYDHYMQLSDEAFHLFKRYSHMAFDASYAETRQTISEIEGLVSEMKEDSEVIVELFKSWKREKGDSSTENGDS